MSKSRGVISAIVVLLLCVVALGAIPSCAVSAKGPQFFPGDEVWVKGAGFPDPSCNEAKVGQKSLDGTICYAIVYGPRGYKAKGTIVPKPGLEGEDSFYQYGKYRVEVDYDGFTFHGDPITAWYSEKKLTIVKRAPRMPLIQK